MTELDSGDILMIQMMLKRQKLTLSMETQMMEKALKVMLCRLIHQ